MKNEQRAFTLIELLAVISIIGFLATLAGTSLNSARVKGRDAKKMVEVRQVGLALNLMQSDTNTVPMNYNAGGTIPACEDSNDGGAAYEQSLNELVVAKTIGTIPRSPGGAPYCYFDYGGSDGQGATFFTVLEGSPPSVGSSAPGLHPPCYVALGGIGFFSAGGLGDFDGDGKVDSYDIFLIQRGILGMFFFTAEQKIRADVNKSRNVTSLDLAYIQQYILGISHTFPACD